MVPLQLVDMYCCIPPFYFIYQLVNAMGCFFVCLIVFPQSGSCTEMTGVHVVLFGFILIIHGCCTLHQLSLSSVV